MPSSNRRAPKGATHPPFHPFDLREAIFGLYEDIGRVEKCPPLGRN